MNNKVIKSFTDLNSWKEGHRLVILIYGKIKLFPPEERFALSSQISRAVVSITSNIAEGFSRYSTKEKTKFVKQWAKNMKIEKLYDGIQKKEELVNKICLRYNVKLEELAYIGDDVNDIALLKKVGLSATPADGIEEAKKICDYICTLKGGAGVFRELADLVLEIKG